MSLKVNDEENDAKEKNSNKSKTNEKKLGRGLAALLDMDDDLEFSVDSVFGNKEQKDGSDEDVVNFNSNELKEIDIDDIAPNSDQPRKHFNDEKLLELSKSIKNSGLLQPIVVTKDRQNGGKYLIVTGERRYRACKIAGLSKINAIVLNLDECEILKNAVIENVQREDLNPLEEANAYKKIVDTFGYTHEQLAQEIGKSRAHITNLLRILKLPDNVLNALKNDKITLGHAKVLLGVENPSGYLSTVIDKQLSVRQLEKMIANEGVHEEENFHKNKKSDSIADATIDIIKRFNEPVDDYIEDDVFENGEDKKKSKNNSKSKSLEHNNKEWQNVEDNIKVIEEQLSDSCGFDVKLKLNRNGSGKFEISFENPEDLQKIIKMFQ